MSLEITEPGFIDHTGERLVGPGSLREALDAAEPGPGGMKLAVSVPEGRFVAMQIGKSIVVRQVPLISGRSGSRMSTGKWLLDAEVVPSLGWRPG